VPHRHDSTPGGRHAAGPEAAAGRRRQGESQDSRHAVEIPAPPSAITGGLAPADPAAAADRAAPAGLTAADGPAAPAPGSAAAYEAEERRQEAFDVAWRYLAHRDRTEAEVRRNFTRKRIEPALVEEVVAALLEGGYVDDAKFAERFVEDRRNLDAWGSERIERRLNELGVERAQIRAALARGASDEDDEGGHDELQAACDLLARRFPHPPETPRDLERALGFLVRKGYELELAHDALRKHANATIEG
jgi:regulatory protein